MHEIRTASANLIVVALAFSFGLLPFRAASGHDLGLSAGQHAPAEKTLRHVQARLAGINLANNTMTLRDASGEMAAFELGPDIAGVDTLQPGDTVSITYRNAVLTHVDKVASSGIRERIETEVMQPASDGEVTSTRSVEFVASVLKIDRKNREVTLRGPTQTQELDAAPTVSLNGLKVGDTVRADFAPPVATSVVRVDTAAQ